MNKPISTHQELKSEIERLLLQKREQELLISSKVLHLSDQLKPVNLLKSFLSSAKKDDSLKNQFASMGAEAAIGFILSNTLFRKSNPVIKMIITLAGTSVISKLLGEDVMKYVEKIKAIINKFRSSEDEPDYDNKFDENDIYNED